MGGFGGDGKAWGFIMMYLHNLESTVHYQDVVLEEILSSNQGSCYPSTQASNNTDQLHGLSF